MNGFASQSLTRSEIRHFREAVDRLAGRAGEQDLSFSTRRMVYGSSRLGAVSESTSPVSAASFGTIRGR